MATVTSCSCRTACFLVVVVLVVCIARLPCHAWEVRFDGTPPRGKAGGNVLLRPNATSGWRYACFSGFNEANAQSWFGVSVAYSMHGPYVANGSTYDFSCAYRGGAACSRNCTSSVFLALRHEQWKTSMTASAAVPVVHPAYWSEYREFCDDGSFGSNEAFAVCRSSGFSPVAVSVEHVESRPNGNVWLSNLSCPQGAETIGACAMQYPVRHCASGRAIRLDCGVIPAWLIAVIVGAVLLVVVALVGGVVWYLFSRQDAQRGAGTAAGELPETDGLELGATDEHREGWCGEDDHNQHAVVAGVVVSDAHTGSRRREPHVPPADADFSPKLADLVGHKADVRRFLRDAHVTTFRDLEDSLVWAIPPVGAGGSHQANAPEEAELLWQMRRLSDIGGRDSEATVRFLEHLRVTRREQPAFHELSDVPP